MDSSFVSIDLPLIEHESQLNNNQEGEPSESKNNNSEYEVDVSLELSRDENTIQQELQTNSEHQRNFEKEASELLLYVKELLGRNEEQQALIVGLKEDLEKEKTRKILNDVNSCYKHKKAVSKLIDDSLRKDKEILHYKTIFALLRNAKSKEDSQAILKDFDDEFGKKEQKSPNMNSKSPKTVTPSRISSPKSPPTDSSISSPNTKIMELRKQLATSSSRNKKLQQEVEKWKSLASSYEKMFGIVKVSVSLPNENNETND